MPDLQTVIDDLHRIANWLAEDTDNDNAQEAAADLVNAAIFLSLEYNCQALTDQGGFC